MTLFELLKTFQPCTDLKITIVSPYVNDVNERLSKVRIYNNHLLDDICESTLNKINVEFMTLYSGAITQLPYIKVFISAKTESALIPLITRLNYEYERTHR